MTSHRLIKNDTETTATTRSGHLGMSRGTRRAIASVAALIGAGTAAVAVSAPADASPTSHNKVWAEVADCESGGDWGINTGNGYYGGVQFDSGTWAAYDGHKYASQANKASEREQIEVARRVLDKQGPGAWPTCGAQAGLTKSNGEATDAPLPPSDEELAKQDAANEQAAKEKAAQTQAAQDKTAQDKTATQQSAPAPARRPSPTPRPQPVPRTDAGQAGQQVQKYVVQSGDTLSAIAEKLGMPTWAQLEQLNKTTLSDPDLLTAGQVLLVPAS